MMPRKKKPVGMKFDGGKMPWDLLPIVEIEQIVAVLKFGAEKYDANNWQLVENPEEKYYAAAMRHIVEYRKGEIIDPESKLPHLAHAQCDLMFLAWFQNNEQ